MRRETRCSSSASKFAVHPLIAYFRTAPSARTVSTRTRTRLPLEVKRGKQMMTSFPLKKLITTVEWKLSRISDLGVHEPQIDARVTYERTKRVGVLRRPATQRSMLVFRVGWVYLVTLQHPRKQLARTNAEHDAPEDVLVFVVRRVILGCELNGLNANVAIPDQLLGDWLLGPFRDSNVEILGSPAI